MALSSASAFEGEIVRREFLGSIVRFGILVAGQEITVDEVFHPGTREPHEIRDQVRVEIPASSALWLGPTTSV